MLNKEIYTSALHLLAQSTAEDENQDYEERAPFIIASFCNEVLEIDQLMRKFLGLDSGIDFHKVWLALDELFPLLDRFAPIGAKYLAAMLVIDEDSELSDKLYEMYCDAISTLRSEIPCVIEKITNKY